MPPRKPPAKSPAKSRAKSGELVRIASTSPSWPAPSVPLKPEFHAYRDKLLRAVHASRGTIASDVVACDNASAAAQDAQRWRRIADLLISDARKAGVRPDLKELATASARAESATRSHSSLTRSLGIRGDRFGARRAGIVAALEGVADPEDEWEGLIGGGNGVPEEPDE